MRKLLPIVLIWRDKTIDMKGETELRVPLLLHVGKGRHLKIKNVPSVFILKVVGSIALYGKVSLIPIGKTEADIPPVPHENIRIDSKNYKGKLSDQKEKST